MSPNEIAAEVAAGTSPVAVPLVGKTVRVLPVRKWRASATRALREGVFDVWAEKSLVKGDYAVWQSVDPDMDEVEAFFDAWNEASGQTVPNA